MSFFYVGLIKLFFGDVRGPSLLTDSHVCLVAVRVLWLGEGCVAVFGIGLVRVLVHVADLITAERVWLWLLCVFICVDMLGYKVSQQNNLVQIWQLKSITFESTGKLNNRLFIFILTCKQYSRIHIEKHDTHRNCFHSHWLYWHLFPEMLHCPDLNEFSFWYVISLLNFCGQHLAMKWKFT